MTISKKNLSFVALSCAFALNANAASTLFTNVDVFNGTDESYFKTRMS